MAIWDRGSRALDLADRGLRLQVHHWVGSGDGLCGSFHRPMETITVTPADIIYHRRLAVLEHAQRCGNVSEAWRSGMGPRRSCPRTAAAPSCRTPPPPTWSSNC